MNEERNSSILLKEPIQYLIFNRTPITINPTTHMPIRGYIVDKNENVLILHLAVQDIAKLVDSVANVFLATCNYRSKCLQFELSLLNYNLATNVIYTEIPKQGDLVNYRAWERTPFDDELNGLCVTLDVDTMLGLTRFRTRNIREFSYNSISLFIYRSDGLVMPHDVVKNITIEDNDNIIFNASGNVVRIEESAEGKENSIFVVVSLNDPNDKLLYDIEPNKRHSDRYSFENPNDAFIEFVHPFSKIKKTAQLIDISNYGISVVLHSDKHAMPIGLMIEQVSMQLLSLPRTDISLRVKAYSHTSKHSEIKVSMEFVNATAKLIKEVSSVVQFKISKALNDATYEDIEALWCFYFETGFIYEGKRKQIQNSAEVVKNTLRALLKHDTPLMRKILYKEDGEIKGHVTGIKVYDRTLLIQHLNALKTHSVPAAMQVIRGITSYFMDENANNAAGCKYLCFYYRPENTYPELVFGTSVKLIQNEDLCWLEKYQFCLPEEDFIPRGECEDYIDVHKATTQDLADLEVLLIRNNEFRIMKLEGLAQETMMNMAITDEYDSIGLYRYRYVFVAKSKNTGDSVYAVCTYASPGMNFSELTNAIKLYYSTDTDSGSQYLVDAVCELALQSYGSTQMGKPVLLIKENQLIPTFFRVKKNYTLFALDLSYMKKFKDATEHVFANFKEMMREHKKHQNIN